MPNSGWDCSRDESEPASNMTWRQILLTICHFVKLRQEHFKLACPRLPLACCPIQSACMQSMIGIEIHWRYPLALSIGYSLGNRLGPSVLLLANGV